MTATLIALLFAHVIADFVVQTGFMVAYKQRPAVFGLHIASVAVTAAVALGPVGFRSTLAAVLAITGAHAVIDAVKTWAIRPAAKDTASLRPLVVFLADQGAHLASVVGVTLLWPTAFAAGAWPELLDTPALSWLLRGMVVLAGFIAATRAGAMAVGLLMAGLSQADSAGEAVPAAHRDPGDDRPEPVSDRARQLRAGVWIGWLERALVFTFVLLGQFNATGLVIAAKSILRFDYARNSAQSELVIIGTLASFGWAVATALLTRAGLAALS